MSRYISRLGLNQAKRLFLTAEKIEAEEMLRIGFLTELVDADRLLARVDELSGVLAGMARIAFLGIKKPLNLIARAQVDMDDIEHEVRRDRKSNLGTPVTTEPRVSRLRHEKTKITTSIHKNKTSVMIY